MTKAAPLFVIFLALITGMLLMPTQARADFVYESSVNPSVGIWLGGSDFGQSFVAEENFLESFGFRLGDWNPHLGDPDLEFSLYRGVREGDPIFTFSTSFADDWPDYPHRDRNYPFFDIAVNEWLETGAQYTMWVHSPSGRGGMYFDGSWQGDLYADGTSYSLSKYTGDIHSNSYDTSFRMTQTTRLAGTPEPGTMTLLGSGLVMGLLFYRRKRRQA